LFECWRERETTGYGWYLAKGGNASRLRALSGQGPTVVLGGLKFLVGEVPL